MKKMIKVACLASFYVASGAGAEAAGSYGEPLLDRNSSFSVQFENAVNSVLGPLDAATRPVSDFVRPVTGGGGFAGAPPPPLNASPDGEATPGQRRRNELQSQQ